MKSNTELLTVEEIAGRLRVKPSWVYTHAEMLGAYHLGKYLRFSWERIVEYLEKNSSSLGQKPNDQMQMINKKGFEKHREQVGNRFRQKFDCQL